MPSELNRSYELIGRIFTKLVGAGLRKTAEDFGLEEDDSLFDDGIAFLKTEQLIKVPAMSCPV